MDSRVIIVIGTGRSGSSAIAGALHHSGIPMGLEGHLILPAPGNKKGFYEDICFWSMAQGMLGAPGLIRKLKDDDLRKTWLDKFAKLIESHRQPPLWGIKNPGFCAMWHHIEPLFSDDIRIVAIHRRFDGTVRSRIHAQSMSIEDAEGFHTWSLTLMNQELYTTKLPIHHVQYEALVEQPGAIIPPVLSFCSEDMDVELDRQAAIKFIEPSLKHF